MPKQGWNTKPFEITQLCQSDFDEGTYRIKDSGYYQLKEDICFNPNSEYDWQPRPDQPDYSGPEYQLGFFAAITVEANEVTIDLNGHELKQSEEHALQQRFYSNIELASSPFIPHQGPADFTEHLCAPEWVLIKNGILGRSSHHGIHGNGMKYAKIENVKIRDFEVAAIALNGGCGHRIYDVTVGPSRQDVPVLPTYSAGRFIRTFLKLAYDELTGDDKMEAQEILANLQAALDNVFDEVINGNGVTSDPLFRNNERNTDGNVYGVLFNPLGVAVEGFTYEDPAEFVSDVEVHDLKIHKLIATPKEVIAISKKDGSGAQNDPAGAVFRILEWSDPMTGQYVPNVIGDAMLFLAKHQTTLSNVGKLSITQDVVDWAYNTISLDELLERCDYQYKCNGDSMFHVNKGILAMRIDGVTGGVFNNIRIYDIENHGKLGNEEACGAYEKSHDGQTQIGYSGADVKGIIVNHSHNITFCDTKLRDFHAWNGICSGVDVMYGSNNICVKDVCIFNFKAGLRNNNKEWRGISYDCEDVEYTTDLPNLKPTAYGIKVGGDTVTKLNKAHVDLDTFDSVCEPVAIITTQSGI